VAKHLVTHGLRGARPGWNEQGHPFYAHGVRTSNASRSARRPAVSWSLARLVRECGAGGCEREARGYVVAPPWECDVTDQLQRGENAIEVVVFGTLKNTLGRITAGTRWAAPGPACSRTDQGRPAAGEPVLHGRLRSVRAVRAEAR